MKILIRFIEWLHRKVDPDYMDLKDICVWLSEYPPHESVFWFKASGVPYEAFVAVLRAGDEEMSPYIDSITAHYIEAVNSAIKDQ